MRHVLHALRRFFNLMSTVSMEAKGATQAMPEALAKPLPARTLHRWTGRLASLLALATALSWPSAGQAGQAGPAEEARQQCQCADTTDRGTAPDAANATPSPATGLSAPPPPGNPAAPARPPLTLVTPFVAGSGPDQVAHAIAREWARLAGEPVQVINMPENQGRTAARWVATSATDGRLMMLTSARMLDAGPVVPRGQRLRPENAPPIALRYFQLVARVGELPFMTVLPRQLLPGPMQAPWPLQNGAALHGLSGRSNNDLASGPASLTAPAADPTLEHIATRARTLAATSRLDDLSANPADPVAATDPPPRTAVFPPLLSQPTAFPATDWNGLLVSSRMEGAQVRALRRMADTILALPEVRWTLAHAGSDLWEEIPPTEAVEVLPLPLPR